MSVAVPSSLDGDLVLLGRALGLVAGPEASPVVNDDWFVHPEQYLGQILRDPDQREAALDLAALLGSGSGLDLPQVPAGQRWIPLISHQQGSSTFEILVVVEEQSGGVDLSLGGRIERTTADVVLGITLRAPLIRLGAGSASFLPGVLEVAARVDLPGGLGTALVDVGGLTFSAAIPVDAPADAVLAVVIRDLRLPGEATARDVTLSELAEEIGSEGLQIGLALLQARLGEAPEELGALLALLGLNPGVADIPSLPVGDLFARGLPALRDWASSLTGSVTARIAWARQLAALIGITPASVSGAATPEVPLQLCLADGTWEACLTLVVLPDPVSGSVVIRVGARASVEPGSVGAVEGRLAGEVEFCRVTLGPVATASALNELRVVVELGSEGAPLVDTNVGGTRVRVGRFLAGVRLQDRRPAAMVEAHQVRIGPTDEYPVLDLTSAEAVAGAAASALDDIAGALLDALGIGTIPVGRALAALAGLVQPASAVAPWPSLVSLPELFSDPVAAIACYHARVLGQAGKWAALAEEFGVLLQASGVGAPAVDGTGTLGDPWTVELFDNTSGEDPARGRVDLVVWSEAPAEGGPTLRVSVRARPEMPPLGDKVLTLTYEVEMLAAALPPADACAPPTVEWLRCHSAAAELGTDLKLVAETVEVRAESVQAGVRWCRGEGGTAFYHVVDPEIVVGGAPTALPDIDVDWGDELPSIDLGTLPWSPLEQLVGDWFEGPEGNWLSRLGSLMGWLPSLEDLKIRLPELPDLDLFLPRTDWPSLSLEDLVTGDPWTAVKAWLSSLLGGGGGDFPDLSPPLLAWLSSLFPSAPPPGDGLTLSADGTGTYDDPWALRLADDPEAPELLLWLDPEGPSLAGIAGLADHLVPSELTDAIDGGGAPSPTAERLAQLLQRAGSLLPDLRRALSGVDVPAALRALRDRIVDGDGLVLAADQAPVGWTTVPMAPTAHLLEPESFDPAVHLPAGSPPDSHWVFVSAPVPGASGWPGETPGKVIDLTARGLRPEAFDLGHIAGPGPWFVRLPSRADAAVTPPADPPGGTSIGGLDGLVGRLRRAVDAVRNSLGGDAIVLVAHSTSGQIARLVAEAPGVGRLVTIGTPHRPTSFDFLDQSSTGEALRLLQRLAERLPPGPLSGDAKVFGDLLATIGSALDEYGQDPNGVPAPALLPIEDFTLPPPFGSLDGGTQATAVVGRVALADFDRALAAFVTGVLGGAADALPGGGGGITHLGVGARAQVASEEGAAGQISFRAQVRLDLARLQLQPGAARPTPLITARVVVRRVGGWLVSGPGAAATSERPRDPRVRWAEAELTALPDPLDVRARLVLHDAAVFGVSRHRWVIDDQAFAAPAAEGQTLLPEARVLLGEVVSQLGSLPTSGPLRELFRLLEAARLVHIRPDGTVEMPPEPIERLLADPATELRERLADASTRAALVERIRDACGASGVGDDVVVPVGARMELVGDLGAGSVLLRTTGSGLGLGGVMSISGSLGFDDSGAVRGSITLGSLAPLGPGGRPVVVLSVDSAQSEPVRVTLAGEGDGSVSMGRAAVELYPNPDGPALERWFQRHLVGELLRIGLEWAQDQYPELHSFLAMLGLDRRDGRGRLRNPIALLEDPLGWLSHPDALGGAPTAEGLATLSPAKLGVGLQLRLPWDLSLEIGANGDETARVELTWNPPPTDGGVDLAGSLHIEVRPGLEVHPALTATARLRDLPDPPGFEYVELRASAGETVSLAVALKPGGGSEVVLGFLPAPSGFAELQSLAAGAAINHLLPMVLDALTSLPAPVGPAIGDVGDGLSLRSGGSFDPDQLRAVAADPVGELATRVSAAVFANLAGALSDLVGEVLDAVPISIDEPTKTITFTPFLDASTVLRLRLRVVGAGFELCVDAIELPLAGGALRVDAGVCVSSAAGLLGFRVAAEVIDLGLLQLGTVSFLPRVAALLRTEAGAGGDRVEAGLWIDPPGTTDRQGLFVRIPVSGSPSIVCRTGATDSADLSDCVTAMVRRWLAPALLELALDTDEVVALLERQLNGVPSGALLADASLLDRTAGPPPTYDLPSDLFDPGVIGPRFLELLARVAAQLLGSLPALDPLELDLVKRTEGGKDHWGVRIAVEQGKRLNLPGTEAIVMSVVNDASWAGPGAPEAGVTVLLMEVDAGGFANLAVKLGIEVGGVGLRIDDPRGGKLIDLVASVDGVELDGAYSRDFDQGSADLAAARLVLRRLSIPVGRAADPGNPVAEKLLSQGQETNQGGDRQELAPSLSPAFVFRFVPTFALEVQLAEGSLPVWIPIHQAFGPIYVEQVGADVGRSASPDNRIDRVFLMLDGGVSLQGFAMGLDDLSVGIPLSEPFNPARWSLGLKGLALGFQSGGVSIAGGFVHSPPEYLGFVELRVIEYGITAIGAYGEFPDPEHPGTTYTSLFIYGVLLAPLGGPPAFFVTGIAAGVGLNRGLVVPNQLDRLPSFVLVQALDRGLGSNPMQALRDAAGNFPARRGTFWLAVGVRFTSFALIESVAVLAIEIGSGVEVNILGLSRCVLPRPEAPLASIEMALRARFSTREMVLLVQAQLTDNSWILASDVRLTGGFAFGVWFRTGEFVVTLGGYHPQFAKPAYYPDVPRLGFHWNASSVLVIKGEAYFALTASCVMVGGRLEAGYATDVAWATFTFAADALVSFDPFFYEVVTYVRVSAGVKIRICFIKCATIKISASVGAELHVKGPPLGGTATIDLDVTSFTVGFGADAPDEPPPLPWDEFHLKYLKGGDPTDLTMALLVAAGLQPSEPASVSPGAQADDGTADHPWKLLPEFELVTATRAASNQVVAGAITRDFTGEAIDCGPMKEDDVGSVHRIALFPEAGGSDLADTLDVHELVGDVPRGVWDYVPRSQQVADAKMRKALVGVRLSGRAPEEGPTTVELDQVEKGEKIHPLPFHGERAARASFFADRDAAAAYAAARTGTTAEVLTFVESKIGSGFESRVLGSERAAPPRIGSLAAGMVDEAKEPVAAEPVEVTPELVPAPGEPGRPRLDGVLRLFATPQVEATPRTTAPPRARGVARRRAPTLAGAQTAAVRLAPARLEMAGAGTAVRRARTVAGVQVAPTAFARAGREVARAFRVSPDDLGSLRTLEQRLAEDVPLLAGDVHVWSIPNSALDGLPQSRGQAPRPSWTVAGDQTVRTVVLSRTGRVLAERTGNEYTVGIPEGAARIVTVGAGRTHGNAGQTGLSGWYEGSQLAQIGSGLFLASDAVVRVDRERTLRRRRPGEVAIVPAGTAVAGARTVQTRLPAGLITIGVALIARGAVGNPLEGLVLGLEGARRTERAPVAVAAGSRIVALFEVVPDARADAITVSVAADRSWRTAGVFGAAVRPDRLSQDLSFRGLAGLIGKLVGCAGGVSAFRWAGPEQPSARRRKVPSKAPSKASRAGSASRAKRAPRAKSAHRGKEQRRA